MKLATILTVVATFHLAASTYSQSTRVNISAKNTTYLEIFNEIEKQSEFRIFYKVGQLDLNKHFDYEALNATVSDVLSALLAKTDVSYELMDKIIVITPSQKFQDRKISGKVTDANSGEPLIGAYVYLEGTQTGSITDANGQYTFEIPNDDAVLVFSYVGYLTERLAVAGRSIIDVALAPDVVRLGEVVVTALGIEKSKKSLNYSTELVNMESITTAKDVNLGNALAGKIAGVSITSSSSASGVSGNPRIDIRGNRTINGNNEPLIVVDGNPYSASGGGLSSINPDDVQSMNVLKGPAASALYGSMANNGVILVTTKKGKIGAPRIEINSIGTFDIPYLYPEMQNVYGQGFDGEFRPTEDIYSWGPEMKGQTVVDWTGKETTLDPQPDNIKDFFSPGYNLTNSISYSAGTEKSTSYFSYSNTAAKGVLPDNKMQRHNFNLRLTSEMVKGLKMDFKITWFRQHINDQSVTGDDLFSPMNQLIRMPRSLRTSDIETSSYYDETGALKQNTWIPNSTLIINPYWSADGYEAPRTSNNVNSLLMLKYDFTSWLYLQVRGGMSFSNEFIEEKKYWDTQYVNSGKGNYMNKDSRSQGINGDVLLGFNKDITPDFHLSVNLGAEIRDSRGNSMKANSGILSTENKFAMNYATQLAVEEGESRTQMQSIYGMAQLGFRNYLFLDITSRNDWNSTLPPPFNYFYPSVGVTGVISDMFNLPDVITFAKVRGSYAEVGNGANFAMTQQNYGRDAQGPSGLVYPKSTKLPIDLIPEKTKSWEAGGELRLLGDRLGVDFTWYKSNSYNQLILITSAPSSGYGSSWINCGNIQNKGVEVMVTATPVKTKNFNWTVDLNFAKNTNKVIKVMDNRKDSVKISSPNLSIGETWAIPGRPFGEVYTKGFVRNADGEVIVDETGMPRVMADYKKYVGNFNYDWRSGITNTLQYKNWQISFLIDLNYGGVRQSATEALMMLSGSSKESLYGRDGFIYQGVREVINPDNPEDISYIPNDITITAQSYAQIVGGRTSNGCGEAYNHSATNSRLRELSVGYTIPLKSNMVKSLRVSAVGRNLFYIYNDCKWFDPDGTYDNERNGQGAESAFLPGTRTIGVNIKLTLND